MSAPRFEIVQTDAGWHSRSIAANGQTILTSEVYTRREPARNAIRITAQLFSVTPVFFDEKDGALYVNAAGMRVELRDVDERTPKREPWPVEPPFYVRGDFWHDRDYHWRHCFGDDECDESVPPIGTPVRGRIDTVTYPGGEA